MKRNQQRSTSAARRRITPASKHHKRAPDVVPEASSELVETLLGCQATVHDPVATRICATAAGWVYSDDPAPAVASSLERIGLGDTWCTETSLHNDAMLVESTAVLVQSACGRVAILCYRGTEPRNLANWMVDMDVNPKHVHLRSSDRGTDARVHVGFYRNLEATWPGVARGLERALEGKPASPRHDATLRPLEALFITGHSLGAAMAAMAGVYLATEPARRKQFRALLRGVYTFGQPMIGNPAFAAACEEDSLLREGIFRHVYGNDIAAHVPAIQSGTFRHFGREFRATNGTDWHENKDGYAEQAPSIVMSTFVLPSLAFVAKQLASTRNLVQLGYSWYDHLPFFYVQASTLETHPPLER